MGNYKFKLYIVENNVSSATLVERLKEVFNHALKDNYSLEVIDILQHPELAVQDKILASPTLIMEIPPPPKRIIGNMNNGQSLLLKLDLVELDDLNKLNLS